MALERSSQMCWLDEKVKLVNQSRKTATTMLAWALWARDDKDSSSRRSRHIFSPILKLLI